MIKCNLAVLLAERGLKMADVINDTSLSKTAVRGLYYNESKGIQYDTLEILCDYLNVGPEDLIKKIDFSYDILEKNIDKQNETIDYLLLFSFGDIKYKYTLRLKPIASHYLNDVMEITPKPEDLNLELIYHRKFYQDIFAKITMHERLKIEDIIVDDYKETFYTSAYRLKHLMYYDELEFE